MSSSVPIGSWFTTTGIILFGGLTLLMIVWHVVLPSRGAIGLATLLLALVCIPDGNVVHLVIGSKTDLRSALLLFTMFGTSLAVLLGEILQSRVGRWLTAWRGEKWAKELDYVYLLIGAVGIVASVNRIESIDDGIKGVEQFGPILLVIAAIVRFTKTRAEIGGWSKPASAPPKAQQP